MVGKIPIKIWMLVVTAILMLSITASNGTFSTPSRVSPPPDDAHAIGMTPAEIQDIANRKPIDPSPLTDEEKAVRAAINDAEIKARQQAKEGLFRRGELNTGINGWTAGTVSAFQGVLGDVISNQQRVSKLYFPKPYDILVYLHTFGDVKDLRRDIITLGGDK